MSDRLVIMITGIVGLVATTALALLGQASTAAIVAPMAMGIINIFLRTQRHQGTMEVTTSKDGGTVTTTVESDDTGVIRTGLSSVSHQSLPIMLSTPIPPIPKDAK